MKIGIDVRNLSIEQKKFSSEFLKYFIEKNEDALVNIYSVYEFEATRMIKSKSFQGFFGEQVLFLKRLLDDKNDLVITFNDTFPIFYNKRFVQVITSLEKLLYPNIELSKTFKKHTYQTILKTNLKKAEKLSSQTVDKEPKNSTYLDTYAWIFYQQGNYTLAKFYIERAFENLGKEKDPGVILEHYGDILLKSGNETILQFLYKLFYFLYYQIKKHQYYYL